MTEKKEFPDLPDFPEIPEFSNESGIGEDNSNGEHEQAVPELSGMDSLDDLPTIPEPPAEPTILPFNFVAEPKIVEKMQALIQQKKEEAEERARLASMPKQPYRREEPRVGRNDLCPCGSGKKYKKCHMDKDLESN